MVDRTIQYFIWFVFFIIFPRFLFGQDSIAIINPKIKTLRTYIEGNDLASPVIELNSENQVRIEFDIFDNQYWNIDYQVVHCNANNQPTNVMSNEFMEGFEVNSIKDYAASVNTTFSYVNYRLLLPNDDVKIITSGNYEVRFFKSGHSDSLLAVTHFLVYESLISIQAEVVRPVNAEYYHNSQEIRLTLNYNDVPVNDVFNDLEVHVVQNRCPFRVIKDIKPVFVRNTELVYAYTGENIMPGGNEFRTLDTRSLKYKASSTNRSELIENIYHITPRTEESRSFKHYFNDEDFNGQYMIYADNAYDYYRSADYAMVHPSLSIAEPMLDGNVYLLGGFNYWQPSQDYKMNYNFNTHCYEGAFLIKQGIYNYLYVTRNNFTGEIDLQRFEGSHDETENNYQLFVFYKGITDDLQRLVGYRVINSKFQEH